MPSFFPWVTEPGLLEFTYTVTLGIIAGFPTTLPTQVKIEIGFVHIFRTVDISSLARSIAQHAPLITSIECA